MLSKLMTRCCLTFFALSQSWRHNDRRVIRIKFSREMGSKVTVQYRETALDAKHSWTLHTTLQRKRHQDKNTYNGTCTCFCLVSFVLQRQRQCTNKAMARSFYTSESSARLKNVGVTQLLKTNLTFIRGTTIGYPMG